MPLYFSCSSDTRADAPQFPGIEYPYRTLMRRLWELLGEVIADPERPPQGILIPPRLIRADGSTWQ